MRDPKDRKMVQKRKGDGRVKEGKGGDVPENKGNSAGGRLEARGENQQPMTHDDHEERSVKEE